MQKLNSIKSKKGDDFPIVSNKAVIKEYAYASIAYVKPKQSFFRYYKNKSEQMNLTFEFTRLPQDLRLLILKQLDCVELSKFAVTSSQSKQDAFVVTHSDLFDEDLAIKTFNDMYEQLVTGFNDCIRLSNFEALKEKLQCYLSQVNHLPSVYNLGNCLQAKDAFLALQSYMEKCMECICEVFGVLLLYGPVDTENKKIARKHLFQCMCNVSALENYCLRIEEIREPNQSESFVGKMG